MNVVCFSTGAGNLTEVQLTNTMPFIVWMKWPYFFVIPISAEICHVLLSLEINNATEVFGRPIKLKSSMTLFSPVMDTDPVFQDVLNKYFSGKPDYRTLKRAETGNHGRRLMQQC